MSADIRTPNGNGEGAGGGVTAQVQDDALFERLCRDPGSLYSPELESLIPRKIYVILWNLRELFRCGGLFFEVTVSPRNGACRLVLTTKCRLYQPYAETFQLPDPYVARAVAERLDRWSTGRCATKKRAGKWRPRSPSP